MHMENKKKREILLAVAAVFVSLFLYRFFGRMVKGLVKDEFLGNMLAQAVFALFVLAARSEEHTSELSHRCTSRMPSSA